LYYKNSAVKQPLYTPQMSSYHRSCLQTDYNEQIHSRRFCYFVHSQYNKYYYSTQLFLVFWTCKYEGVKFRHLVIN